MDDERKLLPCPFCGGTNIQLSEGTTFRWRYIGCAECGAQMEFRSDNRFEPTDETWQDAAETWNRRHAQPTASAEPVAWLYEAEGFTDAFSKTRLKKEWLSGSAKETPLYSCHHAQPAASEVRVPDEVVVTWTEKECPKCGSTMIDKAMLAAKEDK